MRTFYHLLVNSLMVTTKNTFVWFALTFWIYLETKSVLATGWVGGTYLIVTAVTSLWFGSLVDHHKKKSVMLGSSIATFIFFTFGLVMFALAPEGSFATVSSPLLWLFVLVLLCGSVAGNVFNVAMPTLVTVLVPEKDRDKANGLLGTIMGVSFAITSVASGLILGFASMLWALLIAVLVALLAIIHLYFIPIPEDTASTEHGEAPSKKMDVRGTVAIIKAVPGLFALIFFTMFNNFLGGVFMALMDAYGLSLVSVQVWGVLWGGLSFGFIIGGLYIAKKGLGKDPLRNLFRINLVLWTTSIFFTIQPSIVLLLAGMAIWVCLMPFVEATEQTVIQKVVPLKRQGRVFGFAHSIEQAATPLTAFLIGPIAQYVFIPFMTTGAGVDLIGDWYGTGAGRGIALVFSLAGMIGLTVTLIAMRSKSYKSLAARYME